MTIFNIDLPEAQVVLPSVRLVYARVLESEDPSRSLEGEFWLANDDNALSSKDFRGRRVKIFLGYITVDGREEVERAEQWVMEQHFHSEEGQNYLVLRTVGLSDLLRFMKSGGDEYGAGAVINGPGTVTDSIQTIVEDMLSTVNISGYPGTWGLNTPAGNLDTTAQFPTGIFKEYKPTIELPWGTNALAALNQAMSYTKCVLIPRPGEYLVRFPDSGDPTDYTYDSGGPHVHVLTELKKAIVIPNRIIYVDSLENMDLVITRSAEGQADDTDSQGRIGTFAEIFSPSNSQVGLMDPTLTIEQELQMRAEIILAQIQVLTSTGVVQVPLNPGQELWDKVSVTDTRNGITQSGRVTTLDFIWNGLTTNLQDPFQTRQRYDLVISLGAVSARQYGRVYGPPVQKYVNPYPWQVGQGELPQDSAAYGGFSEARAKNNILVAESAPANLMDPRGKFYTGGPGTRILGPYVNPNPNLGQGETTGRGDYRVALIRNVGAEPGETPGRTR